MSGLTALTDTAGVAAALIGDEGGRLLECARPSSAAEMVAATAAAVLRDLGAVGEASGLGRCEQVTVKSEHGSLVIGRQRGAIAVLETSGKRSTGDLESWLRDNPWSPELDVSASAPIVLPELMAAGAHVDDKNPAFAGDLELFALPDLLEFLRHGRRTGRLTLRAGSSEGVVQVRLGLVTAATSPSATTISSYFIDRGLCTADELFALVAGEDDDSEPAIARALLDRFLVTPEEVSGAVIQGIQDAIRELTRWLDGRFEFVPGPATGPAIPGVDVEIDAQAVLLNIFAHEDDLPAQG